MEVEMIATLRYDGSELQNHFYHQKHSESLAIIYPGAGYPCMAPLLYYATNQFLEMGFDVLNMEYDYRFFPKKEDREHFLVKDFEESLARIPIDCYKNIILCAKSVSTRGLSLFLEKDGLKDIKHKNISLIWLTPMWNDEQKFEISLKNSFRGLHIIGDRDEGYYSHEKVKKFELYSLQKLVVLKGADHSLDQATVDESIKSLEEITKIISKWSKEGF